MTRVTEHSVSLPHESLANADWADAYSVCVDHPFANALSVAHIAFEQFPRSVEFLMAIRNAVVKPFGLKTDTPGPTDQKIGFFPLLTQSPQCVVLGMNDRHLDFRLVIEIDGFEAPQTVKISTIIHRHNLLGRIYLKTIEPFHRAIVRSTLKRLAKSTR